MQANLFRKMNLTHLMKMVQKKLPTVRMAFFQSVFPAQSK